MARKPRPKKTEEEKEYWKGVWQKALGNMPFRTIIVYHDGHHIEKHMPMSVVVYAQLLANKNLDILPNGSRRRRVVTAFRKSSWQSRAFLLNVLTGNLDKYAMERFSAGLNNGKAPRHPAQRARLLTLAENGREIAWDYLRLVGKDHLYSDEYKHEELYSITNPKHLKKYKPRR